MVEFSGFDEINTVISYPKIMSYSMTVSIDLRPVCAAPYVFSLELLG